MSNENGEESPYALEVGARLRSVRRQKGLSLEAMEEQSEGEFRASILGAYERGQRRISVRRLHRLAELYGVPIEYFLPPESDHFRAAAVGNVAHAPRRRVALDLGQLSQTPGEERNVLQRYVAMIQVERRDRDGRVLCVRWEDLRIIGAWFRLTADGMYDRLDQLGVVTASSPSYN
jgi:transcriptional regulator with XRE-family HTH domain